MSQSCQRALLIFAILLFLGFIGLKQARSQAEPGSITLTCEQSTGLCSGTTSCNLGTVIIPLKSAACTFQLSNTTSRNTTVSSFSFTGGEFQIVFGLAPWPLDAGFSDYYSIVFAPTQTGVANGTLTVHVQGYKQPFTATVTGTGGTTSAVATLSTTDINFGNVAQGVTSAAQQVTITNSGTEAFKVNSVTADPPFFTGSTPVTTVQPGGTYVFDVYFQPSVVGNFTNSLTIVYDSLPVQGIDLNGAGTATTPLEVTNFQIIPALTQGAAYNLQLAAAGGKAPYTWALQQGSSLPSGLTMSSTGLISGTVSATAKTGTHYFTARVRDSEKPAVTATKTMTATIDSANGASCNNISWDVTGTTTLMEGLDVLGTGTYQGSEGGLYPSGSNSPPASHLNDGITFGKEIQPLDANGNPDSNGKIGLLALGESIVYLEGENIAQDGNADPGKNPAVVVVNGGQAGATQDQLVSLSSAYWTTLIDYLIPNYGVTPEQIEAIWIEPVIGINSGTFPSDISMFQADLEQVMENALILFPNLKVVYLSSRYYAGYSNGVATDNPEPYAYETGFGVKWAIQDQIDGAANLNYNPANGPVVAAWMDWGPYYWSNGLVVPDLGGLVWTCQDFQGDGIHPTSGKEKVANLVLNFLKADPTAAPWFLAPAGRK